MRHRHRAVSLIFPVAIAGFFHPFRDHIHSAIERENLPLRSMRTAVKHISNPVFCGYELKRRRPFGAEAPMRNRRGGVALDIDDFFVLDVDQLRASDCAIRADRSDNAIRDLSACPQAFGARGGRGRVQSEEIGIFDLAENRPARRRMILGLCHEDMILPSAWGFRKIPFELAGIQMAVEIESSADQGEMSKRLREVSQRLPL